MQTVSLLEQQPEILKILKIRAASMQKGGTFEKRDGRPGDCFIYVISGSSVYKTADNQTFHLSNRSLLFIKSGMPYSMVTESDEYSYIFVEFQFSASATPLKCEQFSASDFDFEGLFRTLLETDSRKNPDSKITCISLLYQIYSGILKQYTALSVPSFKHAQIERASYEMQKYFKNPDFSVSAVAGKLGMSETYFRRLFKSEFGVCPVQYLLQLRIAQAKNLLTYGKAKISEVATASGFSDIYYFSRQFKKQTGLTPTEYKRYVNSY